MTQQLNFGILWLVIICFPLTTCQCLFFTFILRTVLHVIWRWECYLFTGKTMATLTHHKKSVRAMALHPKECVSQILWINVSFNGHWYIKLYLLVVFSFARQTFASASADNIKKFNLPKGEFLHNMLWVLTDAYYYSSFFVRCLNLYEFT